MSTSQSYVILDVPCEDAHGAAGPPLRCTNINTLDWNVGQICWYLFNLLNNSFAKEKEGSFVHIIRERCTNGDQRTSYRLSILSWFHLGISFCDIIILTAPENSKLSPSWADSDIEPDDLGGGGDVSKVDTITVDSNCSFPTYDSLIISIPLILGQFSFYPVTCVRNHQNLNAQPDLHQFLGPTPALCSSLIDAVRHHDRDPPSPWRSLGLWIRCTDSIFTACPSAV